MSFSQELVAPIAPPQGLGFGHPVLGAAFSHQATGWGFVVRNHLKQTAKVKDSPCLSCLCPRSPIATQGRSFSSTAAFNLLNTCHSRTILLSLLPSELPVPQVSLGRPHTRLCGCLEQETSMLFHLCYSMENCLHQGHFDC